MASPQGQLVAGQSPTPPPLTLFLHPFSLELPLGPPSQALPPATPPWTLLAAAAHGEPQSRVLPTHSSWLRRTRHQMPSILPLVWEGAEEGPGTAPVGNDPLPGQGTRLAGGLRRSGPGCPDAPAWEAL